MSAKQIGLSIVLIDFLGLTGYVVWQYGYVGLFQQIFANGATTLAAVDLVISLGLILAWIVRDARERRVAALPYVVLTLLLGSAGPLLYLIRHGGREQEVPLTMAARTA
jgi:hypothetical protein